MRLHATLASVLLLCACSADPPPLSTGSPAELTAAVSEPRAGDLRFAELPAAIRRRALRHHHDRASADGSAWAGTTVGDPVRALYRPDVDGIAFYEVAVRGREGEPRGALILATGPHDAPLAEIDSAGAPPTALLAEMSDGKAARTYRLAAGAYVAEDEGGGQVARLGEAGYRIDRDPEAAGHGSVYFGAGRDDESDYAAGPQETRTRWTGYGGDWAREKERFADDQAERLRVLAQSAAPLWAAEDALAERGEGLVAGATHVIPLPAAEEARVELRGEGARYATARVVRNDAGGLQVELTVREVERDGAFPFSVELAYDGLVEELPFFALGSSVFIKGLSAPGAPPPSYLEWMMDRPKGEWTPSYAQIPDVWLLGMKCWSGCGPTAWTILTAFYDRNSWWGSTFVRQGATESGPDVLAPYSWSLNETGAQDVRDMILDLGGAAWDRFGTTCSSYGGPSYTFPYRMRKMDDYLRARMPWLSDPPQPGDARLDVEMWWSDDILGKDWITDGTIQAFTSRLEPRVVGYGYHYAVLEGYSESYAVTQEQDGSFSQSKIDSRFLVNFGWDWDKGNGPRKASGWIRETLWYSAEIDYTDRHPVNGCDGKKGNEYRCCVWPRKPGCALDEQLP